MKLKLLLLLTLIMTFTVMTSYMAGANDIQFDTPITLKVNGEYIASDTEPFMYNTLTFVPIRLVSDALCADSIEWNGNNSTVTIVDNGTVVRLKKGDMGGYINGRFVKLAGNIKIVNDRTYVPVRFISEAFGATVGWDSNTYTVIITKNGIKVPAGVITHRNYTDDEIYWLSRLVHAESEGEPMQGKIAVANTVLNRVKSGDFPNSIYEVIFDKKYGVQYEPTINGTIYNTPSGDSIIAAKRALRGENVVSGCLYFLNPDTASNTWIPNNRAFFSQIGNHDFYM